MGPPPFRHTLSHACVPQVSSNAAAVNKVREATLKSLRRRSRKAAFAFVIAVAGSTILSELLTGRGDAPVVKWHIAFLGVTAVLAAYTSFAENNIVHIDFTQSGFRDSQRDNKDGS
jgi:fatty acid desaturase